MSDESQQGEELEDLLNYLSATRGFDFTAYKRSSISRRIRLRMQQLEVQTFSQYQDALEVDPEEFNRLFDTMLINITDFFRDKPAWDYLAQNVIPAIIESKEPHQPIRVWSAGCASGQEALSLAMLFVEALGTEQAIERVKIYGTDVDEDALTKARSATYTESELKSVPEDMREKYFNRTNAHSDFRTDLRRLVIYGRHDLMRDAPISRVDLLACRNTLMYFNAESQDRILSRFFFALQNGGYLFLGKAETLLTASTSVTPVEPKFRIFKCNTERNMRTRLLDFVQPGHRRENDPDDPVSQDGHIRETVFDVDPVAQVVFDRRGKLALTNERARQMFRLSHRDIGRAVQDLELSYRPTELRSLLDQAYGDMKPIVVPDIEWAEKSGERQWLNLHLVPLQDRDGTVLGVKAIWIDVTENRSLQDEIERNRNELHTAYEELQSANEELETTNEELQSTIEELETTNEEVQSTNEELETMNEELQSTNEELEALNDRLRERSDELNRVNMFLESVLRSIQAGVIVVNRDMQVQVWNERAEDQWGLRADETVGRHLLNLDIGLPVQDLLQSIRENLNGASEMHALQLEAINRRGRNIRCDVQSMPLTYDGSSVSGVILLIREGGEAASQDGS